VNKLKLVLINGYPGSGKDTFVELCEKFAEIWEAHSSDPAKQALRDLGWDGEKSEKIRAVLAYLVKISYAFNKPQEYLKDIIDVAKICGKEIVFYHVREPENLAKFKQIYPNAVTLFIDRDIARAEYSNASDNNVENFDYDVVIPNNGDLIELEGYAKSFMRVMKEVKSCI
jgi:hypothetical protein